MLKLTQLLLRISTGLLLIHGSFTFATENSETSAEISILTTQLQVIPHYVKLDGRLEAINQGTISAQTSGVVEAVNVDVNDAVEAGQTLVIINNTQQQAQLSQAQANLAQAQALNEDAQILQKRNRSLFTKKTVSQGELDSSIANAKSTQASVLAATANVKQAQEQLSYTQVKAPYSGIVSQRMVQVGELVSPGQALMAGFSPQPLRTTIDIPQHFVSKLNISADKPIKIQANSDTLYSQQYTLFPYADSRYSSIRARIDLPNSEQSNNEKTDEKAALLPGSWVEVLLPIGERKGIFIPQSAILQQGEVASLYVKQPITGTFKLRYIRLGQTLTIATSNLPQVEIIAGLSPDEEIALDALAAAQQLAGEQLNGGE